MHFLISGMIMPSYFYIELCIEWKFDTVVSQDGW